LRAWRSALAGTRHHRERIRTSHVPGRLRAYLVHPPLRHHDRPCWWLRVKMHQLLSAASFSCTVYHDKVQGLVSNSNAAANGCLTSVYQLDSTHIREAHCFTVALIFTATWMVENPEILITELSTVSSYVTLAPKSGSMSSCQCLVRVKLK